LLSITGHPCNRKCGEERFQVGQTPGVLSAQIHNIMMLCSFSRENELKFWSIA
jgi:hypothetical protein